MKRLIKLGLIGGILLEFLAIIGLSTLTLYIGTFFIIWVLLEMIISGIGTFLLGIVRFNRERAIIKKEIEDYKRPKMEVNNDTIL